MNLEKKIKNTIEEFKLFNKKDKIVVACSGGKDSTTALYVLNKLEYNIEALFIDLGISNSSKPNQENIEKICKELNIKLHIFSFKKELNNTLSQLHKKVIKNNKITTCALCGVLKRYYLNKIARQLGATKLVTGHNLDDEAENILLNIFGGNLDISLGLGPISGQTSDKLFVPRVKPLYYCSNKETRKYTENKKFKVIYEKCPLLKESFRKIVRDMIKKIEKNNPKFKINIVKNFLKKLPKLRKEHSKKEGINYCIKCGEPSRQKVCKKCELII